MGCTTSKATSRDPKAQEQNCSKLRNNGTNRTLTRSKLLTTKEDTKSCVTHQSLTDALNRYDFLAGTQWMCPANSLAAVKYSIVDGSVELLVHQILLRINFSTGGYIFGDGAELLQAVEQENKAANAVPLKFAGTITPSGEMKLNVFHEEKLHHIATGKVCQLPSTASEKEWIFEFHMQTESIIPGNLKIEHVGYLVSVDNAWSSLPGTGSSVYEFLHNAGCDDASEWSDQNPTIEVSEV